MTAFLGYIAASLDGRIADAAGGLGWLDELAGQDSDHGYAGFYAPVTALVMGRATHDAIAGVHPWPYPGKPAYVVTRRRTATVPEAVAVPPDFPALGERLRADGHRAVWIVGGGRTLRGALDAGMLDSLRVFVMPTLLGGGPVLVGEGTRRDLALRDVRRWPGGVVELSYEIGRDAA